MSGANLPAIRWVGSPNYTPGRSGHNPDWTAADPSTWIVLHTMVGSMGPTIAAFASSARQASSTYGVGLDGSIVQFVKESDAPWTNGTMQGVGSNLDSITIEHEDGGDYNGPRTPALYEASAQLVADIARRRHIPLVHRGAGGGVLGHKECTGASTACPDSLDIARIIARAIEINAPGPPVPPPAPPAPLPDVHPSSPIAGVVFDTPTNDRSFLDYASVAYVPGQIAAIGTAVSWTEAKQARDPSTGAFKWLDHIAGGTWALWDECVDDGGFDPPHFAPAPVVVPPVDTRPEWQRNLVSTGSITFKLLRSVDVLDLISGAKRGTVGPGDLIVGFSTSVAGVPYWVTAFGSTHGDGLRKADVQAAIAAVPVVEPPVVVTPPVTPPVVVPPVAPPVVGPPDPIEAPPGGWAGFIAWLKRVLGIK